MFTGIIEEVATITERTQTAEVLRLTIDRPADWELTIGQSIATNGACLTVVSFDEAAFSVELMPETLAKTVFADEENTKVNLERAMLANGRFEGHVVQGHVDTLGTVQAVTKEKSTATIIISYDPSFDALVVEKGSITINGVSLTAWAVQRGQCAVSLIPHTLESTNLSDLATNDAVHVEFDIIGKYYSKSS